MLLYMIENNGNRRNDVCESNLCQKQKDAA